MYRLMRSMRNDITRIALAATELKTLQNSVLVSPAGRGGRRVGGVRLKANALYTTLICSKLKIFAVSRKLILQESLENVWKSACLVQA